MHTSENVNSRDMKENAESRLAVVGRSVADRSHISAGPRAPLHHEVQLLTLRKCTSNATVPYQFVFLEVEQLTLTMPSVSEALMRGKKKGKSKDRTCSHESFNLEPLK